MSEASRKLTLDDILELRAYERIRSEFRAQIIELKKRRRVQVGEVVTLVFENRETIRFQIQEMARAERTVSDEALERELEVYNPLIPEKGSLSATMFLELTSDEMLRHWLPRLVGIQHSVFLESEGVRVRAIPDPRHEALLTREDTTTSSVHYLAWRLGLEELKVLSASDSVSLLIDHPNYQAKQRLELNTITELRADLAG